MTHKDVRWLCAVSTTPKYNLWNTMNFGVVDTSGTSSYFVRTYTTSRKTVLKVTRSDTVYPSVFGNYCDENMNVKSKKGSPERGEYTVNIVDTDLETSRCVDGDEGGHRDECREGNSHTHHSTEHVLGKERSHKTKENQLYKEDLIYRKLLGTEGTHVVLSSEIPPKPLP